MQHRLTLRTARLLTLPPLLWAGNAVIGRLMAGPGPPPPAPRRPAHAAPAAVGRQRRHRPPHGGPGPAHHAELPALGARVADPASGRRLAAAQGQSAVAALAPFRRARPARGRLLQRAA